MVRLARASEPTPSAKLLLGVIFSVLVLNIDAGPSRAKGINKCVSFCKESTKFIFESHTTDIYEYNTHISTSIIGGTSEQSNLYLDAQVEISSPSPCEIQLQVTNAKIEESQGEHLRSPVPGTDELIQQLQQNPLRFSFQDGKVEHICAAEDDPIWVLNIKRGIVSTFQNTMGNLRQEQSMNDVDVSGRCLTKYQPSGTSQDGSYFVQRLKDLKGCSQHHSHLSVFQSIPYTSSSPTQTIPLLTGNQVCSQTISDNKINHVECKETHIFQPFQNGENGAQTNVIQKLKLLPGKDSSLAIAGAFRMRKTSLVLEIQSQYEPRDTEIKTILTLLETLEKESFPKVQLRTPEHFIDLVQELRFVKYDGLKTLLARAPGRTGQLLLDALPLVGTSHSLKIMRELFTDGKLSESQAEIWLGSLNFIKNPDIEMISAIRPLLDDEPRNQVLLSASSLVHSYCKENEDCNGENTVIEDTLVQLVSFLGTNCRLADAKREDLTGIVVALKAIGNAGRLPSNDDQKGFNTLRKCFEEKSNPTEIRLAAVDAFRRIPCRLYKHDSFITLFTNQREDTEVRIHAYLNAIKCPDRQLVKTIEGMLYSEAVNQVGSFVWTHLTNLQETSSPDKQTLKELVSNNFLQNKFSSDARKYSRNYEATMYWEEQNVGIGVDSNVIFVPDSFIPRSAMLNLTCHLFGESVNLVEFGARVHSLEALLEPLFGPDGYFPDQTVNEALHTMRVKRDVFNKDVPRLDSVYSQATYGNDRLPGGSIYTRIFGNELTYKTFEISHKSPTPTIVDETGRNLLDITHLFDNLRTGKSTEFTKSSVLMDASYTVSTSVGIPLTLAVQSAATVTMRANGRLDLANFWDKNELELEGMLRPSAAIQVHGTLSVQLGKLDSKVKSGLKIQHTMHSSTASQAKMMMKGSKIVHLSLSLPEDKQEIFEIQSQLLLVHPAGTTEITGDPLNRSDQKICTPEFVSNALGIQLCGESNMPENFSMFSPASLSVYIEKTDVFKSYELDYKWENDVGKSDIAFVFSTPGSKIKRRVGADFHFDKSTGQLAMTLESPNKFFRADGRYTTNEQGVEILLNSDNQSIFHLNAALRHLGNRVEPNLFLSFYDRPILEIEGEAENLNLAESGGKANLDLTLKHLTSTPINLKGDLVHNGETFDSNLSIQSYLLTGNARSQFKIKPNSLTSKADIKYSIKQSETQSINLSGKIQQTKKGSLARYSASAAYTASHSAESHAEIEWEIQTSRGYCENTIKGSLGRSKWEGKVLYNRQNSKDHRDIHLQMALAAPRQGIDYNLEFIHQYNTTGLFTKFIAKTDPKKELNAYVHYITETETLLKKSLVSELTWPATKYSLRASVNEVRPGDFEFESSIIPNRGEEMKGSLVVKNIATVKSMEQSVDFRIRGFLASVISGSASISASEKLRHIGGQFQIDGNKEYSGRWSTSLDYSLVKKNTQKIEGKLNLNEKKYTSELTWRRAKNGDRVATLDMKLNQHIRMEAQVKGVLPQKVVGVIILYPDLDKNPGSKIAFKSIVDSKSSEISLDYFGQVAVLSGSFDNSKMQLGAKWTNNMLFNLTIIAPNLELQNIDFSLNLDTQLEGLNKIGFTIHHQITESNELDTEIQTYIEDKKTSLALKGILSSAEYRGTVIVDISNLPRLEGNILLGQTRDITNFEVTGVLGDKSTFLKIENRRLLRGFDLKIDFSGCTGVPEIFVDLKHQKLEDIATELVVEWGPNNTDRQTVNLQVVAENLPWNYKFLFTSPFKSMEKLDGNIIWKTNKTTKSLEINLDLPFTNVTPIKLTAGTYHENYNFKHEAAFSWPSRNVMKTVRAQTLGQFSSFNDMLVKASVKVPNHNYEIELQRKKNGMEQATAIDVVSNKDRASLQTNWHYENTHKLFKVNSQVTAQWASQPLFDILFDYDRTEEKASLHTYAIQEKTTLFSYTSNFQFKNWQYWDVTGILNSELEWFPIGSFVSKNTMEELGEIHHISEVSIIPKFHNMGDEPKKVKLQFDFDKLGVISGILNLNKKDFKVNGKLLHVNNVRTIQLEMTSPTFDPIKATGEYQPEENGASLSFNAFIKGKSVFKLKSQGKLTRTKIAGELDITLPKGQRIESKVELDLYQNSLEISLKENQSATNAVVSVQILSYRGQASVDIQSKFFSPVKGNMKYEVGQGKLDFNGKYLSQGAETSITGLGIFTDDIKKFYLSFDGSKKIIGEISLSGYNKLSGSISSNDVKVFMFSIEHSLEKGDYAFGKHIVKVNVFTGIEYIIIGTAALDMDKVILTLNTPFKGWSELKLSTQFKFEENTQTLSVIASKETEIYKGNYQAQISMLKGDYLVTVETPFPGIRTAGVGLKYSLEENSENKLVLSLEEDTITLIGNWSPTKVELKAETPFEFLKSASIAGEFIQSPKQYINLIFSHNDVKYQMEGNLKHTPGTFAADLAFTGAKQYNLEMSYDVTRNYKAELTFTNSGIKHTFGGYVDFGDRDIHFGVYSPISGFENISAKISHELSDSGEHVINLDWNLNETLDSANFRFFIEPGKLMLIAKTPFEPWGDVLVSLDYAIDSTKRVIDVKLARGDGKYFELSSETQRIGGNFTDLQSPMSALLKLEIKSNLTSVENFKLNGKYHRERQNHEVSASCNIFGEQLEGKAKIQVERTKGLHIDVDAEASAPAFGVRQTSLAAFLHADLQRESTLKAEMNFNGKQHTIESTFKLTKNQVQLRTQTSFHELTNLLLSGQYKSDGRIDAVVQVNEKRTEVKGQIFWGGLSHTKIVLDATSPFEGFRTVHIGADSNFASNSGLASIIFQNDRVRYIVKFDGLISTTSGHLNLQINSPIYKLEQVVTGMQYNSSGINIKLERNTKTEVSGQVLIDDEKLHMRLLSKIPGYLVDSKSSMNWGKGSVGGMSNFEAGFFGHKIKVKTNIEGIRSVQVEIDTTIRNYEKTVVQWNLENNAGSGSLRASYDIPKFGQKSIRSSWDNEDNKHVKGELWLNSTNYKNQKGFTIQYSIAPGKPGGGKFVGSLNYVLDTKEHEITMSTAVKVGKRNTFELLLKTPFQPLKDLSLTGTLILNPEIAVDLSIIHNQQKLLSSSANIFISPLNSKVKLSFNAPVICDPFNFNAAYDLTTIEKTLEVSFLQNEYQITVKSLAVVPQNSQEIELRMTVDSNVPSVTVSASGSLKAGYKVGQDGNKQVALSIDSEQTGNWKIVTSFRTLNDFNVKFSLESPVPDVIPSIQAEAKSTGNYKEGLNNEFILKMKKEELKATLVISPQKFLTTFKSTIPGMEDLSLEGKLDSNNGYKAKVEVSAAAERLSLTGEISLPFNTLSGSGSIILSSSWKQIPSGSLDLKLDDNGDLEMKGIWGERNVGIRGHIRRESHASLLKSGTVDLTFILDSQDQFQIQSNHYIDRPQFSVNITSGDNKLKSYIHSGSQINVLSMSVEWEKTKAIQFYGETSSGHFNTSVKTPWTPDFQSTGNYVISSEEHSAKGTIIFDGTESILEANVVTKSDSFKSRMNVDIPLLNQKMEAIINIDQPNEYNVEGNIELNMVDRNMALRGVLSTTQEKYSDTGKIEEKTLQLSILFPNSKYSDISTEFIITKPVDGFASLKIDSNIVLPSGVSKATFQYELPIYGSNKLSTEFSLQSPTLLPEPISGSFNAEIFSTDRINATMTYGENDVKVSWNLGYKFSTSLYAYLPDIYPDANPVSVGAEGHFDFPNKVSFHIRASYEKHSLTTDTTFLQTDDGFNSKIFIHVPMLFEDKQEFQFKLNRIAPRNYLAEFSGRNGRNALIAIGEFLMTDQDISLSGKVTGVYGSHFIQIVGNRNGNSFSGEISAESLTLLSGRKVVIAGKVDVLKAGFSSNIECRTRKSVHAAAMRVSITPEQGFLNVKLTTPGLPPLLFDSEYKLHRNAYHGKLSTDIHGELHSIEFKYELKNLEVQLTIICPWISQDPFNIQFRCAIGEKDISLLGDLKLNGSHWRLEGTTRFAHTDDMEIKLELITPEPGFQRTTLAFKLARDEVSFELHAPMGNLPSLVFSLKGIPVFEELNWRNMSPELIIGLPSVTCTASVVFRLPDETTPGEFRALYEQNQTKKKEPKRFDVGIHMSPLGQFNGNMDAPVSLKFQAETPFANFRNLAFELGGNVQWKNWAEITLSGNFNDQQISFKTELQSNLDSPNFSAELITPFKNYERFTFIVRVQRFEEIGHGQSVQMEFYHPGWEKPINLEIDYNLRFDGFINLEGELSVKAPGTEIPPLTLQLTSVLKDSSYNAGIQGSWGEQRPSIKITAESTGNKIYIASVELISIDNEGYRGSIELEFTDLKREKAINCAIKLDDEKVFAFKLSFLNHSEMTEVELALTTPFETISSASTLIRISPLVSLDSLTLEKIIKTLDIHLEVSFNAQKLIHFELVSKNGRRSLIIQNPFQPISIAVSIDNQPAKLRAYVELCWDLLKPEESRVGFGLTVNRKLAGGYDTNFKVLAGERGSLDLYISHLLSDAKFDHNMKIKWNRPSQNQSLDIGFGLLLNDISDDPSKEKFETVVRFDMPCRSIQLESQSEIVGNGFSRILMVKWDALRNPYKRVGVRYARENIASWRSLSEKQTLTIIHAGLPHDLTFTLEKSYDENEIMFTEFTLQPNSFPQDKFTVRISHMDMNKEGIQLIFILPSINIDINIIARRHGSTRTIHLSHMDLLGERHVLNIEARNDESETFLDIKSGQDNHLNTIFHLECNPAFDHHTLSFRIASIEFNANFEQSLPLLRANLNFEYGRKINLIAGLPHKKEITMKITRTELGMNINEIQTTVKLNASNILSSRIHWRPELPTDLHRLSASVPLAIKGYFTTGIPKTLAHINDEIEERLELLDPKIHRMVETLRIYTMKELVSFSEEVEGLVHYLGTLSMNNTYVNINMEEIMHKALETVSDLSIKALEAVEKSTTTLFRSATKFYNQAKTAIGKYWGKLESVIMPMWEQAENNIVKIWEQILARSAHIIAKINHIHTTLNNIIEGNLEALEKQVSGIEVFMKLREVAQEYSTWFDEIPMEAYTGKIRELIVENIWHPLEHYSKPSFMILSKIIEERNLFALLEIPPLPYVRFVVIKSANAVAGLWKVVEAEQKIRDLFRHILHNFDAIMQRHIPTASLVYELEKGHIEYHQPLNIFEWEDFKHLPRLNIADDDEKDGRQIVDFYFAVADTLRDAQPYVDFNMRHILPPFEAHAIMAGDYHYYTFDKKYFRFAGECSYVLVADLLHQNFTLVANYETQQDGGTKKKSYSLISGESIIEIDTATLKVTSQGKKAELPLEVGPTFIRRQTTGLEIFDTRGFQVRCTLAPSACVVTVSGWYFGKLGGLLGTYDNEATNDFKQPDGQVVTDVSTFAHSWRVGGNSEQCRRKNYIKNENVTQDVDGICGDLLLNQNSPFRPCFGTVDPTEFMNMCKFDTNKNLNSAFRKESSCDAIAAYVLECQKNKIDLWMPPACVRCKLEDGSAMTSGDNVTLETYGVMKPPNSSDVVILLEEAASLTDFNLNEMINKLDAALEAEGLKENRYALVRFGGKGPHRTPHFHTTSGQVWVHNTLRRFHSRDAAMNGAGGGDLYDAIEFAATIGQRAGVSKVMIGIVADDEQCGSSDRFADALTMMVENDIRLHLLTPKDFALKVVKKNEDGREIFGVDLAGVYTARQSKRGTIEPDTSLRQHVVTPKDFCTPLAMETNGTRFNLKHLHRTSSKKFIDVWSRRVAKSSHPAECQMCECVPDKNGGSVILCTPCISQHLKRFLDDWEKFDLQESGEQNLPGDMYDIN